MSFPRFANRPMGGGGGGGGAGADILRPPSHLLPFRPSPVKPDIQLPPALADRLGDVSTADAIVGKPFPADPLAENVAVCDNFDSYTAGSTLTEANSFYSLWDYADFVISESGQLVGDGVNTEFEAAFEPTWEDGSFTVSFDYTLADATSFSYFVIWMGDFLNTSYWNVAVAHCLFPVECIFYEDWTSENGTFVVHPFELSDESPATGTMALRVDDGGEFAMTVNGVSMAHVSDGAIPLPMDLDVAIGAGNWNGTTFDFTIDNLAHSGCENALPTSSPAPTTSPSAAPTAGPTGSTMPTIAPPPVCDDFNSYPTGSTLSAANPIYSTWGNGSLDFVISGDGNLVMSNAVFEGHTTVLETTWENPGPFSLSIDYDFDTSSSDFLEIAFGNFVDNLDPWVYVVASCQLAEGGRCELIESWSDANEDNTFIQHPAVLTASAPGTITISADEDGLLTLTLDGESIEIMTGEEKSLPWDIDVYFGMSTWEEVGSGASSLDNLAYTGCGGNTRAPTASPAPTSSPTVTPPLDSNTCHGAAVYGDPHFYTFRGEWFSYHGGGTEFILIQNDFIDLHAHFEIVSNYFSGTTDVGFRIGGEVGEIALDGTFYKDGVVTSLPSTIGGYAVTSPSAGYFEIVLGGCDIIRIYGVNDVRRRHVEIVGHSSKFQGTLGLLGSWEEDGFVGRDGVSLMSDETAFGEEWVVDTSQGDPDLFLSRRRLEGRKLGLEDIEYPSLTVDLDDPVLRPLADEACGYIEDPQLYENCLFDVIATNDTTMAETEFYEDPVSEQVMEEFCESNCNSNCEDAGGSCMFRCNSNDFLCVEELCKFIDESKDDGVEDDNDDTVEGCSCGFPLGTEVAHDAASCGGGGREGILSRLFFCF